MSVCNEIKAQIIRAGFTMQEVVDKEVVELADALGYELIWQKRREK